jgi:two-component system NtrC family response regulator
VLQEQAFERLGGSRTLQVDVRVVAATSRDLVGMVKGGEFREDLYYRLNVVCVDLPPLRERREDIPMLVDVFLRRFADEAGGVPKTVSREAMDLLLKHAWPGNVRELENVVHRAVVLARGPLVMASDLPFTLHGLAAESIREDATLPEKLAGLEKRLILEALQQAGGVQTRAARALGITERHLRYRLQKHGLESSGTNAASENLFVEA